jgi:putative oxidoreductase
MNGKVLWILTWVLRIGVAGLFTLSAVQKLIDDPQYIAEFAKVGFGDWFRYVTAVIELAGVLAVLVPRSTVWGAALLMLVVIGAFIAQLLVLHVGWIHCLAIAGLLIGLILTRAAPQTSPASPKSA